MHLSMPTFSFVTTLPVSSPFSVNHHGRRAANRIRPTCICDSLPDAIKSGYVRDFGHAIPLDKHGRLPSSSSLSLPNHLRDLFQECLDIIFSLLGEKIVHAVFIRGSILTGNFMPHGRSDLDFIIFSSTDFAPDRKRQLSQALFAHLRPDIHLSSADVRLERVPNPLDHANTVIAPALQTTLLYYAVPLQGSLATIGLSHENQHPSVTLGIDIREDERRFKRFFSQGVDINHFNVQLSALQWFLKKCLRALAELSMNETRFHCRDLVPCFKACAASFPEYADIAVHALQIACASEHTGLAGLDKVALLKLGWSIAVDLAEIVEELTLHHLFGAETVRGQERWDVVDGKTNVAYEGGNARGALQIVRESIVEAKASLKCLSDPRVSMFKRMRFHRHSLPHITISLQHSVRETSQCKGNVKFLFEGDARDILLKPEEPIILRDLKLVEHRGQTTMEILQGLARTTLKMDCRVSSSNVVKFCRSKHPWIDDRSFTPPSRLLKVPTLEAIERLSSECRFAPLLSDVNFEYVYIQSALSRKAQVFKDVTSQVQVAQEERIWVSCHGTVSPLHYDASFSALYQRVGVKRMLFFPPDVLNQLGIYPLGHPLHRRARVDLQRSDSALFGKFWKDGAERCLEAILRPGDLILFPPLWAHYTESRTESEKELSISHTLRYI